MEAMTSEREAFEKWIDSAFPHIAAQVAKGLAPAARDAKEMAWAGWQAAHLAQPAQAVDVGAIREVIAELRKWPKEETLYDHRATRLECADKLTRALSGEKAGPVDGWSIDKSSLTNWHITYTPPATPGKEGA